MALNPAGKPAVRRRSVAQALSAALLLAAAALPVRAEPPPEPEARRGFAYGELDVVEESRDIKSGHVSFGPLDDVTEGYFGFKERVLEKIGLTWTLENGLITQGSPMEGGRFTANNELNLIGVWQLFDSETFGTGSLWGWYQFSNTLGSTTTGEFNAQLGVLSPFNGGGTGTKNHVNRLQFLAWEQKLFDDRFRIMIGQLATRVFLNLNRYTVSDREDFFTPMVVNNPVALYTARLGLGVFAQYQEENWYASFMARDAAANSRGIDFESLGNGDFEYAGEVGLTPEIEGAGLGMYRLTVHYTEATSAVPSDVDFALSFDQDIGEHFSPFFRYAWSRRGLRAFEQRATAGFQIRKPFGFEYDRFGLAVWWGKASAPGVGNETGTELFYMLQVKRWLEISPDFQVVWNPGLALRSAPVVTFGLRLRTLF